MKTIKVHHISCPVEFAWDMVDELHLGCNCPKFWPRIVCEECYKSAKLCKCKDLCQNHLPKTEELDV